MTNRLLLLFTIVALALATTCAIAAPATTPRTTSAPALTEKAKIEALIAAVEGLRGARFIRNGKEHDAAAAADHLRLKWKHGGDRIATARDFIRHLATKSSLTGRAYRVRFADGREVDSASYFEAELAKLEARPPSG